MSGLRSSFRYSSSASLDALPSRTAAAKPPGSDSMLRPAASSRASSPPEAPAPHSCSHSQLTYLGGHVERVPASEIAWG